MAGLSLMGTADLSAPGAKVETGFARKGARPVNQTIQR